MPRKAVQHERLELKCTQAKELSVALAPNRHQDDSQLSGAYSASEHVRDGDRPAAGGRRATVSGLKPPSRMRRIVRLFGGCAMRPRGLAEPGRERIARATAQCNAAKPGQHGSRHGADIPLESLGKGGLQGGEASPNRTKPNRRAWNGHPGFGHEMPQWPPAFKLTHRTLQQHRKTSTFRQW